MMERFKTDRTVPLSVKFSEKVADIEYVTL